MSWLNREGMWHVVERRLRSMQGELSGRIAVDLPAGVGDSSRLLHELGAQVEAYDLFPGDFRAKGLTCRAADLTRRLPIRDQHADFILCQEGIEHLPDQLHVLREFNRILKPGGRVLITTPNVSHLRARLSHLLVESDLYSRLPPSEVDAVWFGGERPDELYFGHVFLVGAAKLRVLSRLAGMALDRIHGNHVSAGSVALGGLYPLILAANGWAYLRSMRRDKHADTAWKRRVYREVLRLNVDPRILFCKHLIVELRKECEAAEVSAGLYQKFRHAA
jgi:SAM-dependent methyltransferase